MIPQTWDLLEQVLTEIEYKRDEPPLQRFQLVRREDELNYCILNVFTYNENTYKPGQMRCTRHEFVVPAATYNEAAWLRWVFDRVVSIEVHETAEQFFFRGKRTYAPHHGNGWDPYVLWYDGHPDEQAKAPGED